MNNIFNWITTRIMKRMEIRFGPRKEELSKTPFFNGKIIKGCLPNSTIDQLLEYYGQAIRYNIYNLDVIEKVCTIFFHIASTDNKLLQNISSSDWCKYKIVAAKLCLQEFFT